MSELPRPAGALDRGGRRGGGGRGVARARSTAVLTPIQRFRQKEPSWFCSGQTTSLLAAESMEKDEVREVRGGIVSGRTPPWAVAVARQQAGGGGDDEAQRSQIRGECEVDGGNDSDNLE